jgi:hypothetical protein
VLGRNTAMNFTKSPSMLLLAIYLILVGLTGVAGVALGAAGIVLPILALVTGVLILLGK